MADREEYRTDVAYPRTFCAEMSPPALRLAAALQGVAPPPEDGFDYGEIGCGMGDTLVALAAAHPGSRFWGADLSDEHIAFAKDLANRGGVANARFVLGDFEALPDEEVPRFDFLCAHGLLSWISVEKRRAFIAFAARTLKPGGLLYVGYNAMPGWAAIAPLRRLMLDAAAGAAGSPIDKARRALQTAKLLDESGALYFAHNPTTKGALAKMTEAGIGYVVHEYLQPSFYPMYFNDVLREMAGGGLAFLGVQPAYLNFRDLALPPGTSKLLEGSSDRLLFETVRDYALNEAFRHDVYVQARGPLTRGEGIKERHLVTTPWSAIDEPVQREAKLPHTTIQLSGQVFDALAPVLSAESVSVIDLLQRPAFAAIGAARLCDALLPLVLTGQVSPMKQSTPPAGALGARRFRAPLAYNRMVLDQRLATDSFLLLSSLVAGTGVGITMLDAVSMRVLTEVDPEGRAGWIRDFVAKHPLKLHVRGKAVSDAAEMAGVLEGALATFVEEKLPRMVRLGVLEPA